MSKEDWQHNTIDKIFLDLYPEEVDSILDLGCGLSCKSQYLKARIKVGVDIHRPYLRIAGLDYDGTLISYDVTKIQELFLEKSFDVVLLLDIVEHIEKEYALELIKNCEYIARKAVIIETPSGYIPQNIDIQGHGGGKLPTHAKAMGWALRINTNAESKTYYSFRAYLQRHPMQQCCGQHLYLHQQHYHNLYRQTSCLF